VNALPNYFYPELRGYQSGSGFGAGTKIRSGILNIEFDLDCEKNVNGKNIRSR